MSSAVPPGENTEDVENTANVDLQESLGVTPEGNCKRHPNCPVLSLAHNKIMSCRVCFSEEKSVGIRQRKSFAAVVEQLQKTADMKQAGVQEVVDSGVDAGRMKVQKAHSANMQALIVQQPQTMDSIMKRMAQVQNWVMRQKEKEVMSLKLQVQSLEEKLHNAEVLNQENKQTIWALRRTIQQDLKLIKTMADQKERSFTYHESPITDSPSLLASPEKTGNRLGSSGNSVNSSNTPIASPAGKYFMPGPDTPDPDDTTTTEGGNETPEAMQGILVNNPEEGESDPLLDKVRQKKKALQSKFQELRAAHSNTRTNKNAAPRPPNNMMQPRTPSGLMQPKSASAHVPGRPYNIPSNMGELRPLGDFRRLGVESLKAQSNRSLDQMVEPLPEQKQSDIVLEPQDVRTPYFNDDEYASMSADPSKIFSSFRGGLLDIPKSPPAASHDNRLRDRPKVQLDLNQMSALKMPRMRGVGRTLSYQSDDGISLDGLSVGDSPSVASYTFSVTSQSLGSYSEGPYDIPLHSLATSIESLSLSKPKTPDQSIEKAGKYNGDYEDNRSVSTSSSYEHPPPPPLHHTSAGPPPKTNARKPKRTVSSDEVLDVVPEVNEDEDLYGSKTNFNFTAAPAPAPVPSPPKPIPPPPMTSPPVKRPPCAPKMAQDDERTRGDETTDTTPSFFTESGALAAMSVELQKEQEKERFLFTVTGAECQDKYGDTGIYTGTILVTEALPHGKGCMKYQTGRVYDGDWVSGQWHGNGKLLNPNGDTYEGEFVLDARHGKGEYKWDNGDIYTGDFAYDRRNGNGKFLFHNGNVYEGEFVDGMFEGFGRYEFDDGYYEGEWRQGRYHGDGELQYANGGKYTGEFRESLAHGFGVETLPDGTKRRGVWERGQPVEFFHRSAEGTNASAQTG